MCSSWVVLQCFLAPRDYIKTDAFLTLKAFSLLVWQTLQNSGKYEQFLQYKFWIPIFHDQIIRSYYLGNLDESDEPFTPLCLNQFTFLYSALKNESSSACERIIISFDRCSIASRLAQSGGWATNVLEKKQMEKNWSFRHSVPYFSMSVQALINQLSEVPNYLICTEFNSSYKPMHLRFFFFN